MEFQIHKPQLQSKMSKINLNIVAHQVNILEMVMNWQKIHLKSNLLHMRKQPMNIVQEKNRFVTKKQFRLKFKIDFYFFFSKVPRSKLKLKQVKVWLFFFKKKYSFDHIISCLNFFLQKRTKRRYYLVIFVVVFYDKVQMQFLQIVSKEPNNQLQQVKWLEPKVQTSIWLLKKKTTKIRFNFFFYSYYSSII